MFQATALLKYWESHPPTHIIAAAFAGIKTKEQNTQGLEELVAFAQKEGLMR